MKIVDGGVDIVILNCNNDGYIQKCIRSIKHHTEGRYNLIVVDQNSKDGSREWLTRERVASHLILNKMNTGVAVARNQAIRTGNHDWIVFVDSDAEIRDSEWLDKIWNYTIDRKIGLIQVSTEREQFGGNEWEFGKLSFCMVNRNCFNDIGVFDESFTICEDTEWLIRLEWSKWKTCYCSDVNIWHEGAVTKRDCLGKVRMELEKKAYELLTYKYTGKFLDKTMVGEIKRRHMAEDIWVGKK